MAQRKRLSAETVACERELARYAYANRDPYLDAGMRGWIMTEARRNHWRLAEWYSVEDLIQDGYLCYAKCVVAYPNLSSRANPSPDDRRMFMALVIAAYRNYITDLTSHRMHERAVSQLAGENEDDNAVWERLLPPSMECGTFAVLLAQAPAELKSLFRLLMDDTCAGVEYLKTRARTKMVNGRQRRVLGKVSKYETTNEHYCRLLGLDPSVDLFAMAREHFSPVRG